MPTTSHDWDDTITFAAPTGGTTAGVLVGLSASKAIVLPLQTKTSGQTCVGKIRGLVKGVTKVSTAAFEGGDPLFITSALVAAAQSAAGIVNAWAAAPAVSTAVTCDVILTPPINTV
jgi:hypothetical protein